VEFNTIERINEFYCVNGTLINGLLYGEGYLSCSESVKQVATTILCDDA